VPEEHSYRLFGAGADLQPLTEKTGVPMVTWWGMTETMTHPIVSDGRGSVHAGTMGRCAPEYEIAVRDPLGVPTGAGEAGELSVRGVRGLSLFAEYWNNPEATASAFDDEGWFRTGDLVRLNDDGTLTFIDRAKDMLKVGAENVAASEIERVVQTVTGPREIAVVGAPHEALDEVPVVFVVDEGAPEGLADAILAACSAQLADFKVPRQVLFVTHLPRSTISKVNKVELRTVIATGASLADAQRRWEEASIADPSGDASASPA
jgi:crotonobetaine/carnitine-CoA ligase